LVDITHHGDTERHREGRKIYKETKNSGIYEAAQV
jgi:F0F1-type ATP synthase beta subunit